MEIIADVDDAAREVILTIHWRGGQHSQLRVRKQKIRRTQLSYARRSACRHAEHGGSVVGRGHRRVAEPDGNDHGTRQNNWTADRVGSLRTVHGIHGYRSAEKNGEWLTMSEAAAKLGVTNHRIRRLIKDRVLPAEQVVPRAPYQIRLL